MLIHALDTNLIVRLLRNKPAGLHDRIADGAATMRVSTVVLAELLFGAERSADPARVRREVEELLSRFAMMDFDAAAAALAAQIRGALARRGRSIGAHDTLIAGHARSRGLVVVTGNLREFERVEGLRCEDWEATGAAPG